MGSDHQFTLTFPCISVKLIYMVVHAVTAFRAMLQDLNGVVAAKENIAQGRMTEKERTIVSQKSEIERLEKKVKTLEYKVCMLMSSPCLNAFSIFVTHWPL